MESVDSGRAPSLPRSPTHPLGSLSPDSRAEALARGQCELMEMAKNIPESSYELSLKDLVETGETIRPRGQDLHQRARGKMRSREERKRTNHHDMYKGLLVLNMVFPSSFKAAKSKVKSRSADHVGAKGCDEDSNNAAAAATGSSSRKINGPSGPTRCWPFSSSRRG